MKQATNIISRDKVTYLRAQSIQGLLALGRLGLEADSLGFWTTGLDDDVCVMPVCCASDLGLEVLGPMVELGSEQAGVSRHKTVAECLCLVRSLRDRIRQRTKLSCPNTRADIVRFGVEDLVRMLNSSEAGEVALAGISILAVCHVYRDLMTRKNKSGLGCSDFEQCLIVSQKLGIKRVVVGGRLFHLLEDDRVSVGNLGKDSKGGSVLPQKTGARELSAWAANNLGERADIGVVLDSMGTDRVKQGRVEDSLRVALAQGQGFACLLGLGFESDEERSQALLVKKIWPVSDKVFCSKCGFCFRDFPQEIGSCSNESLDPASWSWAHGSPSVFTGLCDVVANSKNADLSWGDFASLAQLSLEDIAKMEISDEGCVSTEIDVREDLSRNAWCILNHWSGKLGFGGIKLGQTLGSLGSSECLALQSVLFMLGSHPAMGAFIYRPSALLFGQRLGEFHQLLEQIARLGSPVLVIDEPQEVEATSIVEIEIVDSQVLSSLSKRLNFSDYRGSQDKIDVVLGNEKYFVQKLTLDSPCSVSRVDMLRPGSLSAIIGSAGSGKTRLLKALYQEIQAEKKGARALMIEDCLGLLNKTLPCVIRPAHLHVSDSVLAISGLLPHLQSSIANDRDARNEKIIGSQISFELHLGNHTQEDVAHSAQTHLCPLSHLKHLHCRGFPISKIASMSLAQCAQISLTGERFSRFLNLASALGLSNLPLSEHRSFLLPEFVYRLKLLSAVVFSRAARLFLFLDRPQAALIGADWHGVEAELVKLSLKGACVVWSCGEADAWQEI